MVRGNPNADIPAEFLEAFRKLVRRTRTPRMFEPETARDYFDALKEIPMPELIAAAERLALTSTFFPSVAEWHHAAVLARLRRSEPTPVTCVSCGDRGVIAVRYHSGEPFDIALCECRASAPWRRAGHLLIRARLQLTDENQIGELADFRDETEGA
jgi:hypothetical protein